MPIESAPLPADPASRARHEEWNAALAAASATQPTREAQEPDARALDLLSNTQAGINPNTGKRYYDESAELRQVVERHRVAVFEGKFDEATARRDVAKALGITLPEPAPVVAPVGTPEQRAADAAFIAPSSVPAETWAGYQPVDLPDGIQVEPAVLGSYMQAARAAGIGQEQTAAFVRGLAEVEAALPERSIAEYVDPADLGRDDWAGYQAISLPAGLGIDREAFAATLSVARRCGITQHQLEAGLAEYLNQLRGNG